MREIITKTNELLIRIEKNTGTNEPGMERFTGLVKSGLAKYMTKLTV